MKDWDDIERMQAIDPGKMYEAIVSFPDQMRKAIKLGDQITATPDDYKDIKNIILCGMGGSAIGGDLARSVLADSLPVPFQICRNYSLPGFAGPDTLVIGSSYSGNTEETLSAFNQAIAKGCRLFAITTGGKMGQLATEHNIPVITIPDNSLQPRAALGYSFVPLMLFLNRIGLSKFDAATFTGTADMLEATADGFKRELPSANNHPKRLAEKLKDRIPIIYTGPDNFDAVGTRIKGQICENAKVPAYHNQFPEMNHNELVGWEKADRFRDILTIIYLRDQEDFSRVTARMNITSELFKSNEYDLIELESSGNNRIERIFSLIQLGDYLSYYLAILNQADPSPVKPIEFLKNRLAEID